MMAFLRRLADLFGLKAKSSTVVQQANSAIEQLQEANRLLTQTRRRHERVTGNPVADLVRGTYAPRKRVRE